MSEAQDEKSTNFDFSWTRSLKACFWSILQHSDQNLMNEDSLESLEKVSILIYSNILHLNIHAVILSRIQLSEC